MKKLIFLIITIIFIPNISCKNLAEETVWVEHTSGYQCSKAIYPTLQSALDDLKNNNITAIESKEENYLTCAACDCPNSLYYQVRILSVDLKKAKELGWKEL